MQTIYTIKLPSFIRRTHKTSLLKARISNSGAKLSRVGRSRNWQLQANFDQLQNITTYIEQQQEQTWLWVQRLLNAKYWGFSHNDLLGIATSLKDLTTSKLISVTDCTIAQARKVIDELEELD